MQYVSWGNAMANQYIYKDEVRGKAEEHLNYLTVNVNSLVLKAP